MSVCVYVSMYVGMYVSMYVSMYVCMRQVNAKTTEPIGLKFYTKVDLEPGNNIGLFQFLNFKF